MDPTPAAHFDPMLTILTGIGCVSLILLTIGMIALLVKSASQTATTKGMETTLAELKANIGKLFDRFDRGDCAKHEAAITVIDGTVRGHDGLLEQHGRQIEEHGQRIRTLEQRGQG